MFSNLKGFEWLIIVAVVLLLFGAKRLPDAARGLGRSLRIFKAETKGLAEDGKAAQPTGELAEQAPAATSATSATSAEAQEVSKVAKRSRAPKASSDS